MQGEGSGRMGRILNLLVGVSVACAILVTGLVVRREMRASRVVPTARVIERMEPSSEPVSRWQALASSGHSIGLEQAPVRILVFSDFQCPACRVLATRLRFLQLQHPGETRVIFRHFPLATHRHATTAALASECAGKQGRFASFHDALFAGQDVIGEVPWSFFAVIAELPDTALFDGCLRDPPAEQVEADQRAGASIGVRSTPTLLIEGQLIEGAPPLDALDDIVRRLLDEAR